jgi:hypothetical protein
MSSSTWLRLTALGSLLLACSSDSSSAGASTATLTGNWSAEYMDWNIGSYVRVNLTVASDGAFVRDMGSGEKPAVWYRTTGTWRVDGANLELSVVAANPLPPRGEPGSGRALPRTERHEMLATTDNRELRLQECAGRCLEAAYRRR